MQFKELVLKNRSYRRFDESHRVPMSTLEELVDLARCTPSAANMQPLKYVLVTDEDTCGEVFSTLGWAAYLADWPGPAEGQRPAAYIVVLHDTSVADSAHCDHGIASQTIMLGAVEKGLGGCMLGSVNREKLAAKLGLDDPYKILLVLALGKPAESVALESLDTAHDAPHKYWRDSDGGHHVPKRSLDELIVGKR